jgi:Tfp pilus assembly protein PilO
MMRFITPIILIGVAVTLFFMYASPIYNNISVQKAQIASYNDALNNSKTLQGEREKLTTVYNNIDPNDLARLQKLLPDNVDNIRLILEIEQIATPYSMTLSDIKYGTADASASSTGAAGVVQGGGVVSPAPKDYGVFNLEFSTSGSYNNFINFTKDLESNLRIVDISSISFSSNSPGANAGVSPKTNPAESYKYDFKINTYWLKN